MNFFQKSWEDLKPMWKCGRLVLLVSVMFDKDVRVMSVTFLSQISLY